jgi:tryptophan synthase beta chain
MLSGVIHGFKCYLLQNADGSPAPLCSWASGLDYPGVGPEQCYLKDSGRVEYVTCTDDQCVVAFFKLCRLEGLIPAIESAHAVAHALVKAREMKTAGSS